MHQHRFLIIKIVALGDIAVTSALLNRILAEHPGARITWLCGERGAPLVRLFPGVDEVLTINEEQLFRGSLPRQLWTLVSTWRKLAARRFDCVLLVHADRRYRVLTWPLVGTRVAALEHGVNPLLGRFRGDEYARLLDGPESRGPLTTHYPLADVRSNLPRENPVLGRLRRVVAIVPGGARNILRQDALRRWPVEKYRELATRLLARGHGVTLIGDAGDVGVRRHFDGIAVTDHIGTLSLVQTLSMLRDADVVVSHDTGPLHFARLVRTPAVALFGPTEPRNMVGEDDDIDVLWGGANLPCRPCYDGRNYAVCSNNLCMKDISVDAVVRVVERRLAQKTITASQGAVPART